MHDLDRIDVEHLLGLATGQGLVKIRVTMAKGARIGLGQVDPATARALAANLLNCAARAEYEQDLATEARSAGFGDEQIAAMLAMIRNGEARRHQAAAGDGSDG